MHLLPELASHHAVSIPELLVSRDERQARHTEYFDVGTMPTEYCDQHFYDSDDYDYNYDTDSSDQTDNTKISLSLLMLSWISLLRSPSTT